MAPDPEGTEEARPARRRTSKSSEPKRAWDADLEHCPHAVGGGRFVRTPSGKRCRREDVLAVCPPEFKKKLGE